MRQKERQDIAPPAGSEKSGGGLDGLREQADRLLAAGDDAIDRALANTDSEAFMRANRQQGGE